VRVCRPLLPLHPPAITSQAHTGWVSFADFYIQLTHYFTCTCTQLAGRLYTSTGLWPELSSSCRQSVAGVLASSHHALVEYLQYNPPAPPPSPLGAMFIRVRVFKAGLYPNNWVQCTAACMGVVVCRCTERARKSRANASLAVCCCAIGYPSCVCSDGIGCLGQLALQGVTLQGMVLWASVVD